MLRWKCHSPSSSVQSISKAVRATRPLIALIALHVWKRPVVKDKHIKMKPRIYVLCVFDLDGEYKFIKNKTLWLLKKYVLGCNLGWMNRRFCIQKDDRNVNGVQHSFLRHRQENRSRRQIGRRIPPPGHALTNAQTDGHAENIMHRHRRSLGWATKA